MNNFDGAIHADTWVWQPAGSRQRPTLPGVRPESPPLLASETPPHQEERVYLCQYVGEISRISPNGDSERRSSSLVIVTSTEELATYIENYTTFRVSDGVGNFRFSNLADELQYDEAFFANNFLAITLIGESSGSNSQRVTAIYTTEGSDTVHIEVKSTLPGRGMGGTADFRLWRHVIEMDRSLLENEIVVTRPRRYHQSVWPSSWSPSVFSTTTRNPVRRYPSLVRINSVEQLVLYYEQNRAYLPQEMRASVFGNMSFNASFFRTNSLVFLRLEETSGSNILEISSVCSPTSSGVVDIAITRTVPEVGTDDMRYWYFVFADSAYDPTELALVITTVEPQ